MSFQVVGFVGNQVASVYPIRFVSISARSVSMIATGSISTGPTSSRSRSTKSITARSAR